MAEEDEEKRGRPDSEFPPASFPSLFADGVTSHVNAMGISKFYFYRIDPNMHGRGGSVLNPVFSVNMPTHGFIDMAAFFYTRVLALIEDDTTARAQWEESVEANEKKRLEGKK